MERSFSLRMYAALMSAYFASILSSRAFALGCSATSSAFISRRRMFPLRCSLALSCFFFAFSMSRRTASLSSSDSASSASLLRVSELTCAIASLRMLLMCSFIFMMTWKWSNTISTSSPRFFATHAKYAFDMSMQTHLIPLIAFCRLSL